MVEYDPFAYETQQDPYPIYKQLRDEAPAYYNERLGFWALSRYDDVRDALIDHDTYCSGRGFLLEDIDEVGLPMVLGMDPPDHTRVRGTVNRTLTPARVAALEKPIRDLAKDLVAAFAHRGNADIIGDFAGILPMAVISEMLGVPKADRARLRTWADEMVHRDDSQKRLPAKGLKAGAKIVGYFEEMLAQRSPSAEGDLMSLLLDCKEHGDLNHQELLGYCFLLIIAGNETTTKLIGNMVYRLGAHPDQRQRLVEEPELMGNAVEEVLRFEPSTHMMARTLTRNVERHGRSMKEGSKVALILASANRDERYWKNPDVFDVSRNTSGSLAFGLGIHHCLGASLARMEGTVALQELMAGVPDFEVDIEKAERVHSGNVRGFSRLPISFTPSQDQRRTGS